MDKNDYARWLYIGCNVWHLRRRRCDGGATVATVMMTPATTGEYTWYAVSDHKLHLHGTALSLYAAQRDVRKALRDTRGEDT